MSRQDFMEQLKRLLDDIPSNERQDALNYYENYFEDAGPENEAKIIEELESPEKVAASIKKDLFGENYEAYEFAKKQREQEKIKENNAKVQRNILIVVLLIVASPIWIGLVGGLFGVFVGLLGAILGIGAALIACVAVFLVVGCILIGIGLTKSLFGFPAIGLIVMGIGILMLTLGILGVLALCWIIGKFIPWMILGLVNLCRSLFQKGRKKEAYR